MNSFEKRKQNIKIPSSLEKVTDIDAETYRKFLLHDCDPVCNGDIAQSYTFHFTDTSVGTMLEVSCPCGYKVDITDYDKW